MQLLKPASLVLRLLGPEDRRGFAIVIAVAALLAALDVAGIGAIFGFFSLALDPRSSGELPGYSARMLQGFGITDRQDTLLFTAGAALVLFLLRNLIAIANVWIGERFVLMRNHEWSVRLLESYLKRPYAYFLTENSSRLSKNLLVEVQRATMGVLWAFMKLVSQSIPVLAIVLFLFIQQPMVTVIIMVAFFVIYGAIYLGIQGIELRIGRIRVDMDSARYKITSEVFGGIKEVKSFGLERYFLSHFEDASKRFTHAELTHKVVSQAPQYLLEMVVIGGLLGAAIYTIERGQAPGEVIAAISLYVFAAYRLLPSAKQIFSTFTEMQFFQASIEAVHDDFMAHEDSQLADASQAESMLFEENIAVENVTFIYPGSRECAVDGVQFSVKKNSMTAIVGRTGAGKSTVMDLIMGLVTPTTGRITVDGASITPENQRVWQSQIGYVPQTVHLVDDTIAHNIAFGLQNKGVDLDRVKAVARLAHIADFIERDLELGYDTIVGEQGIRLSGGQRQRIAIARALYRRPAVLVFDEGTSALDARTEAEISEALRAMEEETTVIVVTHRLNMVKGCGHIVLMEDGRVVDNGSYNELMERSPAFRSMVAPIISARST